MMPYLTGETDQRPTILDLVGFYKLPEDATGIELLKKLLQGAPEETSLNPAQMKKFLDLVPVAIEMVMKAGQK